MASQKLFNICQSDRHKFCSHIIDSSAPSSDFYFLVVLSTLIVALGLLADNVILVIGGMLVTPILSQVLAIALGVVIGDSGAIWRSVKVFLLSFAFVFIVAFAIGFFTKINLNSIDLIKIMDPTPFSFAVAIVAGVAASYTWAKPGLNDILPGVAITVTLIPPMTAIGLAVSHSEWEIFGNVFGVFLLNIFGIILAAIIVLASMDFYKARKKVIAEVKEEAKELTKQKKD